MKDSFAKYLALLMLAIFMTSIGNMSTDSLMHDLQHDNEVKHAVTAIHQSLHQQASDTHHAAETDDLDPDCKSIDLSEHEILHALNHLQFFPDMSLAELVRASLTNTAPVQFDTQFLPLPTPDLLLRPPQSTLLLA